MKKVLVLIDVQNDFLDGGRLGVDGSRDKMIALAEYINKHGKEYDFIVASADFHPFTHCSFEKNGGMWPVHCVQHSDGAAIFQPVLDSIDEANCELHVLTKGLDEDHEEYSVLKNHESNKQLHALMEAHKIEEVDFTGIADIYCVKDSIEDFHREFPSIKIAVFPEFVGNMDEKKFNEFLEKNDYLETKKS